MGSRHGKLEEAVSFSESRRGVLNASQGLTNAADAQDVGTWLQILIDTLDMRGQRAVGIVGDGEIGSDAAIGRAGGGVAAQPVRARREAPGLRS